MANAKTQVPQNVLDTSQNDAFITRGMNGLLQLRQELDRKIEFCRQALNVRPSAQNTAGSVQTQAAAQPGAAAGTEQPKRRLSAAHKRKIAEGRKRQVARRAQRTMAAGATTGVETGG